ncbi:MAG: molecular chaperone DnaJ [Christensenellaceae bacterium]|jgi:molecular chaperone DnaJ|nr:molecular chaperone DnaJ [Christensenellaceae bacterium]
MATNYYEVLGLSKGASADDIKSAYRQLAKKYHPDVFATANAKEKSEAEKKFKDVQHAYDVLSDPQKKEAFDTYGSEEGPQFNTSGFRGSFSSDFGSSDIFSDLFSAFTGGGRSAQKNRHGENIEVLLQLTFSEAYFGVEKEITFNRVENCTSCHGTGAKNGTDLQTCTKCGGRGTISVIQQTFLGTMRSESVCPSCGGAGKIIKEKCSVCSGRGNSKVKRTIKVKIPAGVANQQTLTVRNEGSAGSAKDSNGNLFVVFRVQPHPLFIREGENLKMQLPISIFDAISGKIVEVPTMKKPVTITIPEGTEDGTIIRVRGQGMKILGKESYGDLYVQITIDIPKNLSLKQKKSLKEFESSFGSCKYDKIENYNKKVSSIN